MKRNIDNFTILKYCEELSFHQIAELSKSINRKREEIYPTRRKVTKYGSLSRYIKKDKFNKIINFEKRNKVKLAYELMYNMGLRISEVVEVKTTDIVEGVLIIRNIKCNRNDMLRIPINMFEKINKHIKENKELIELNDNYIFYSENNNKTRFNLSKDWLRNNWRKICKLAEVKVVYDVSREKSRKPRELNLYSCHALRHSFGERFYEKTLDPKLTQIVMRHNDIATTMEIYCRGDREKAFEKMNLI